MGQNESSKEKPVQKCQSTFSIYKTPIHRRFSTLTRRKSFKNLKPDSSYTLDKHRLNLSASSNQNDTSSTARTLEAVLVNINIASEEQLMTLPGVNRSIAKSIVMHRQSVGGFEKADDLVNVPGIRARMVKGIRREICTISNFRSSESISGSLDSVFTSAERPRPSNTTCACAKK